MIELKTNCKYALVFPTSMGVRLTPPDGQPFHCSDTFRMYATSAESNVGSVSSYLGLPVKILTAFVKGSPISRFIKDNLASRHMDYEGPDVEQGDPWGYRHQFNLADSGTGSRGPRVQNDRAGEVGRTLNVKDFDLERIFAEEGVQIVHLSGLVGALSEDSSRFCLDIARTAVAAVQHRAEHGRWPEEPPLALVDPFTGTPMRYEVEGDTLRIWSVGRNLKDDGGVSARRPIEGDIVFELPLPPRPTTRPTSRPTTKPATRSATKPTDQ